MDEAARVSVQFLESEHGRRNDDLVHAHVLDNDRILCIVALRGCFVRH
jgi:hypothetical protein